MTKSFKSDSDVTAVSYIASRLPNVKFLAKMSTLALGITLGLTAQAATAHTKNDPTHGIKPTSVQLSAIDHIGINVPDIDTAISFFSETMNAKVISDITPGNLPDQWKSQFNWHISSELQRFVMLQIAGGAKIELFQYKGTEINHDQPHGDDAGASHIALKTNDINRTLAALKAKNVTILNEPIKNPDGESWFFFQTPWGSQIEIVSLPSKK